MSESNQGDEKDPMRVRYEELAELAGSLAHEIKNPLSVIHMNIDLLSEDIQEIDSPWLQVTMDTGNFLEDPYSRLEKIAPKTVFVQAKTYYGGGVWYSLDLDYKRIAAILRKHDYRGYVSLEYEGREDHATAIPKSLALLRRTFSGTHAPQSDSRAD